MTRTHNNQNLNIKFRIFKKYARGISSSTYTSHSNKKFNQCVQNIGIFQTLLTFTEHFLNVIYVRIGSFNQLTQKTDVHFQYDIIETREIENRRFDAISLLTSMVQAVMTYLKSWEEFEKAGERLYLQNPLKARYTMKYIHKDGHLYLKLTDDVECLQYKTEIIQDLKKVEKFVGNLMKHMASKDSNN